MHDEELRHVYSAVIYINSCGQIKTNDTDRPCGTYGREKRYIQAFGGGTPKNRGHL
jgi:hypothetical protein